jgi:NADH-ubiquinone oxidoreductase chain 5
MLFFKALLFLCAGCIIHSCGGEQDFRAVGGVIKQLPVIFFFMFIGGLTLGGFVFLTGFYSKDFILEQFLFIKFTYNMQWIWMGSLFSVVVATFFTAFLFISFICYGFFKAI